MNKIEYALEKIQEECCEIGQACSKTKRFTPNYIYQGTTNNEKMTAEILDLVAAIFRAQSVGLLPDLKISVDHDLTKNFEKYDKYLEISKLTGTVIDG